MKESPTRRRKSDKGYAEVIDKSRFSRLPPPFFNRNQATGRVDNTFGFYSHGESAIAGAGLIDRV